MGWVHWYVKAFGGYDFEFLGGVSNFGDEGEECVGAFGKVDNFEGYAINGGWFGGVLVFVGT